MPCLATQLMILDNEFTQLYKMFQPAANVIDSRKGNHGYVSHQADHIGPTVRNTHIFNKATLVLKSHHAHACTIMLCKAVTPIFPTRTNNFDRFLLPNHSTDRHRSEHE